MSFNFEEVKMTFILKQISFILSNVHFKTQYHW